MDSKRTEALDALDAAVAAHRRAQLDVAATRTARTKAIRAARKAGVAPGVLARRIGLTQVRVTQLTVGRDAK